MNTPARTTTSITNVKDLLRSPAAHKQIEAVAANALSGERMARVVANAARTTPKLYDCEPMSLLGAVMTCASLGLEPNNGQGHAFLIPFKNNRKGITECQVVIGYRGFIDLAFRSGILTYIDAGVHYSDDELWSYEKGMNFTLRHAEGPQNGQKLHAYAICKWQNPTGGDGTAAVVLPWSKVMATRDASQNWKTAVRNGKTEASPWKSAEDAMAMKTAIRALANSGRMPMSVEMRNAVAVDGRDADYAAVAREPGAILEGALMGDGGAIVEGDGAAVDNEPDGEMIEAEPATPQEAEPPQEPEPPKTRRTTTRRKPPEEDPKPASAPRPKPKPAPAQAEPEPEPETAEGPSDKDLRESREANRDTLINDLLDAGRARIAVVLNDHAAIASDLEQNAADLWDEVQAVIDGLE